jgi:hypothetical protein
MEQAVSEKAVAGALGKPGEPLTRAGTYMDSVCPNAAIARKQPVLGQLRGWMATTRSWEQTTPVSENAELVGRPSTAHGNGSGVAALPNPSPRIEAIAGFLDDCRSRRLEGSTLRSYTNSLGHLPAFFAYWPVSQINLEKLTTYRGSRAIRLASFTISRTDPYLPN